MPSPDPISVWISQLKEGDDQAARRLLERYFDRLVGLARARLQGRPALADHDEDVALSAFKSLCLGAGEGRFPRLNNRNDLRRLLALLTVRKSIDLLRRRRAEEAVTPADLEALLSREPQPELAAEVAEECRRLLDRLGDEELRAVALWKVEGHSNQEIARRLGCVVRSVERKLKRIRLLWQPEAPP
jgi:RNA polymerase sigma factor (sigma-70 family)